MMETSSLPPCHLPATVSCHRCTVEVGAGVALAAALGAAVGEGQGAIPTIITGRGVLHLLVVEGAAAGLEKGMVRLVGAASS